MRRNSGPGRKPTGKESCGNAGAVESVESQKQASHLFPRAPWKSRRKTARFPHSHSSGDEADGKVENQKQVSHFPTATTSLISKKTNSRRASPTARRSAPPKHQRVIVVDREK